MTTRTEEVVCDFATYQEWVCKARSWLGGISGGGLRYKKTEKVICRDTLGRECRIGADFMRADKEGTFPVTAYRRAR